ncbi:hypothetical protein SUGI_1515640 [Cryptomeria japonica]|uniref:Uncharacterized protein n=1 Tax=Cryptomeria japonica TaxID=3369 RepID=A0AAD3RRT6_CRYJA|nr:hypothetical protein SUGI_1515640 [Cryptomeria japonica]
MAFGRTPADSPPASTTQPAAQRTSSAAGSRDASVARQTRSRSAAGLVSAPAPEHSTLDAVQEQLQHLTELFACEQRARLRFQESMDLNMNVFRRRLFGGHDSSTDCSSPEPFNIPPASSFRPMPASTEGPSSGPAPGVEETSRLDPTEPSPSVPPTAPTCLLDGSTAPPVGQPAASAPPVDHSAQPNSPPVAPPDGLPSAISSLVLTAFKDFKRRHLIADRSAEFLRKLKVFSEAGTLPKNLQVKPPKVVVNDSEGNAFLSAQLDSIQADANLRFLGAYVSAMETTSANHAKAIVELSASFSASLASTIDAIKNQSYVGSFSVPSDDWLKSAQDFFDALCNNFVMDKVMKKTARDAALAVRQEARDNAMSEADQLPVEHSVAELINDKLNSKFLALQSKIEELQASLAESSSGPLKSALRSKTKQRSRSSIQPPILHTPRPPQMLPTKASLHSSTHARPPKNEPKNGPIKGSKSSLPAGPKNGLHSGNFTRNHTFAASGRSHSTPRSTPPARRFVQFAEPPASSEPDVPLTPSPHLRQDRGRTRGRSRSQTRVPNRGRSRSRSRSSSHRPAQRRTQNSSVTTRGFTRGKCPSEIDNRISNLAIHNLSSRALSYDEKRVLGKRVLGLGMKFIPRPPSMTALQISEEYRAFARLFRLRSFFGPDSDDRVHSPAAEIALHFAGGFSQKFRMPNPSWNPPSLNVDLEKILKIGERLLCQQISSATFTNGPLLPFRLLSALRNLRKDSTIIIKAADKNLGLVVLDKSCLSSTDEG